MRRKHIAVLFALLSLSGFIALSLVACGGGGGDDEETTPTPADVARTTCKPAEPVVPRTPTDLPPEFAEYQSPERGYSVRYPGDWRAKPNVIALQNINGDAFFAPSSATKITPNFSVACEAVPIGTTSQEYADAKRSVVLRVVGKLPDVEKTLTVDGTEAFSVKYALESVQNNESLKLEKVEVFFADDLGGWVIALTAPEGTSETYRAAFDAFVQSYQRP